MAQIRVLARHRMVPWTLVGALTLALVFVAIQSGSAQKGPKPAMTVREIIAQYDDYDTNLGKIKRIGSEFIIVQQEDAQTMIPFSSIQQIRFVKENIAEPVKLEIKLLAKD